MPNATQTVPQFPSTSHGHPALRAAVILALCGSLLIGFVASSSRPASATKQAPANAASIACDATAAARHAC